MKSDNMVWTQSREGGSPVSGMLAAFGDIILVVFVAIIPALAFISNRDPEKMPPVARENEAVETQIQPLAVSISREGRFQARGRSDWLDAAALASWISESDYDLVLLEPSFNDDIAALLRAVAELNRHEIKVAFQPQ